MEQERALNQVYSAWMAGVWRATIAECRRQDALMAGRPGAAKAFRNRAVVLVAQAIGRVRVQKEIMQIEGDGDVAEWRKSMADTERAVREELGMVETERRVRQQMREDCE